jgi:hypothetical protein
MDRMNDVKMEVKRKVDTLGSHALEAENLHVQLIAGSDRA